MSPVTYQGHGRSHDSFETSSAIQSSDVTRSTSDMAEYACYPESCDMSSVTCQCRSHDGFVTSSSMESFDVSRFTSDMVQHVYQQLQVESSDGPTAI